MSKYNYIISGVLQRGSGGYGEFFFLEIRFKKCFWRWDFYRGNQVKVGLFGWVLVQSYWYPYTKGNLDTKMHIGEA